MIIVVTADLSNRGVRLEESDDFRRFEIRVRSLDPAAARHVLSAVAEIAQDHAFVAPAALLSLPGAHPQDVEWVRQFDEMVEYARSRGWVDADGRVRAHIVWT